MERGFATFAGGFAFIEPDTISHINLGKSP